ncbi:hypothetical protein LCGC14_0258120 [marine sediment metagenome]|uniref:Uncharacterized protein n=1 Tax=marine sediment metagenome TaxID=412755 RepID=A0A0F9X727_9ZZZZ
MNSADIEAARRIVDRMSEVAEESLGGGPYTPPALIKDWADRLMHILGRRAPAITAFLDTPDEEARKMTAPRDPSLVARNAERAAHPLVQRLTARRKRAITAMLTALGGVIKRAAEHAAVADDMMHLWPTSFFKVAAQQGVTIDTRIHFSRAWDPACFELNAGLKCQMTLDREDFAGCEPLPLGVELRNDIPSEEP